MAKTNLDILDYNSWNYVKQKKNKYGLRSVANYIFRIIKLDKTIDLDRLRFLIAIEKFYEYMHYDIDELAFELELRPHNIRGLIREYLGDETPIYDIENKMKEEIIREIHALMIRHRILPRELSIAYYIRDFINNNKLNKSKLEDMMKEFEMKNISFNNRKILRILFPDDEERRKEIYSETINIAEDFVKINEHIKFDKCEDECIMKDPEYIYYKSGLKIKKEDLEMDLISDILKKKYKDRFLIYYGLCLTIALNKLIRRNLLMVKNFIEKELFIFREPDVVLVFIEFLINISIKEFISKEKEKNIIEKYIASFPELSIQ